MKVFIGIVPSDEIVSKIMAFQDQQDFKRIVKVPRNSPPHITLLRPRVVDDAGMFIQPLKNSLRANFASVALGGIHFFHDTVVYLELKSERLGLLHQEIINALGLQENKPFVPHLTLGRARHHLSTSEKEFIKDLYKIKLPSFRPEYLTVFGREIENTPYREVALIQLRDPETSSG
jgi:2'-5' RNA ligase